MDASQELSLEVIGTGLSGPVRVSINGVIQTKAAPIDVVQSAPNDKMKNDGEFVYENILTKVI